MESLGFNDLPDNIKDNLNKIDGHWLWTGAKTNTARSDPKGRVRFQGRNEFPHRVVFFLLRGFNLDGQLQANHKRECPHSLCCNPDCLYEGTQQQNVQDSIALGHHYCITQNEGKPLGCPTCNGKYSISPTTGHRYCQRCKNNRRKVWRQTK